MLSANARLELPSFRLGVSQLGAHDLQLPLLLQLALHSVNPPARYSSTHVSTHVRPHALWNELCVAAESTNAQHTHPLPKGSETAVAYAPALTADIFRTYRWH